MIQQAVAKSYDNANAIRLQWEVGQAKWSDLRGDYTFGFSYRGCKQWCDRDDNIIHSTRTTGT